jgi:hypothetical protein
MGSGTSGLFSILNRRKPDASILNVQNIGHINDRQRVNNLHEIPSTINDANSEVISPRFFSFQEVLNFDFFRIMQHKLMFIIML